MIGEFTWFKLRNGSAFLTIQWVNLPKMLILKFIWDDFGNVGYFKSKNKFLVETVSKRDVQQ